MRKEYTEGCIEYFTDGSVDNSIPTTGAEVFPTNFTGSWRPSNTCSTLQTELIAILKALECSLNNGNGALVIYTDSKSALQAIWKEDMKENSLLMFSIVACLEIHKVQNSPVCLNWIPSHTGIPGNGSADRLANESLRSNAIAIKVQRSLGQIKKKHGQRIWEEKPHRKSSNVDRQQRQICHVVPTGHVHGPSPHRKIDDKKLANDHSPLKTGIQMYLLNCKPRRKRVQILQTCDRETTSTLITGECEVTDDL